MKRQELFTKKRVVVLKDGVIVERYQNLKAFVKAYPLATYNCISGRICDCKDGWLPDGKVARYYADRDMAGTPLRMQMIREKEKPVSERDKWRQDLDETETKIQEAYDLCDAGEISYEERHQRLGWLQNHAAVLRKRLGIRD